MLLTCHCCSFSCYSVQTTQALVAAEEDTTAQSNGTQSVPTFALPPPLPASLPPPLPPPLPTAAAHSRRTKTTELTGAELWRSLCRHKLIGAGLFIAVLKHHNTKKIQQQQQQLPRNTALPARGGFARGSPRPRGGPRGGPRGKFASTHNPTTTKTFETLTWWNHSFY